MDSTVSTEKFVTAPRVDHRALHVARLILALIITPAVLIYPWGRSFIMGGMINGRAGIEPAVRRGPVLAGISPADGIDVGPIGAASVAAVGSARHTGPAGAMDAYRRPLDLALYGQAASQARHRARVRPDVIVGPLERLDVLPSLAVEMAARRPGGRRGDDACVRGAVSGRRDRGRISSRFHLAQRSHYRSWGPSISYGGGVRRPRPPRFDSDDSG